MDALLVPTSAVVIAVTPPVAQRVAIPVLVLPIVRTACTVVPRA